MNLFDFLFPPVCPHCGAHVKQQGDWCDSCIEAVLNIRQVPSKLLSSLDSVWILADYIGGIKSMIYDVKFNEKKEQSKGAAPFLASYNLRMHWVLSFTNHECDTFKDKQKSNRPILEDCEDKYFQWFDCLYKLDTHKEMWSLSGSERRNTIEDAFLWNNNFDSSLIRDKRILLVDDIYTTGATLESAARVLRRYSPQTIEALTIASGSF